MRESEGNVACVSLEFALERFAEDGNRRHSGCYIEKFTANALLGPD